MCNRPTVNRPTVNRPTVPTAVLQPSGADRLLHALHVCSCCQIEEMVDELDLSRQIISCHPSNLPLPDHVDCFVALNGSPGRLEFSESLFAFTRRLMAR